MTATSVQIVAPALDDAAFLSFGKMFQAAARRHPEKPAVIDETGALSWQAFADLAGRVAARLAERGIGPGQMVATLAENSAMNLAVYCGGLIAGACMAPLPYGADPEALAKMLANSGARVLFASAAQAEIAVGLGAAEVVMLDDLRDWAAGVAPLPAVSVAQDDLFDLIYSSGTTGTPKGIEHDHRFRSCQLDRQRAVGLDADAVVMMATPLYSNTTLVAALPVLAWGGTVVSLAKFDCGRFLDMAQRHRASHAMLVPVQYMRLMDFADFDRFDLSAFRMKLSTSAPLPGTLIARVQARWPGNLVEFYGMTEGGVTCVLDCDANPGKWDTVGRPGPGCDLRIIDDEGRELPPGSYGEVVGRAGAMMPGYHLAPDQTAAMIWRDAEGRDFIRTGDMGRVDGDGFLMLLDRKKDMILSGGFNIYAADLEAVLRRHPGVADVAVIAVPSAAWGETPLGLVVPAPGAGTTEAALLAWANAQLGRTQRLSAIEFRDDLPRSAIGKVLKRELRQPYWERERKQA